MRGADWSAYKEEVEKNVPGNYEAKNINKLAKILSRIIRKAANKHVGKKKVSDNSKCYLTEEVKEEISKRN